LSDTLTFDSRFKDDILDGRKTCTLRYDEDERLAGETVTALTDGGEAFAELNVVEQIRLPASAVAQCSFAGHKNYQSTEDVLEALSRYYPTITEEDDPELILYVFQLVYEL